MTCVGPREIIKLLEINFTLDDNHLKIQQVMILIVNQQLRRPP